VAVSPCNPAKQALSGILINKWLGEQRMIIALPIMIQIRQQ